ncbi:MAG: Hsp70 family protein [Firmicutes bacterium]|nr:Hsp70 family protein [Bacillota bacterium]
MVMRNNGGLLGIDFGTSNSCAALLYPDGKLEIVRIDEYDEMFPSCVYLNRAGEIEVGITAEQQALDEPCRFRDKLKKDLLENKPIFLGGQKFAPYQLISPVLAYIKQVAERLYAPLERVVITVPAGYTKREKELMEKAAREAGFGELTTLAEPLAAAIYYARQENNPLPPGSCALIYDFGGGTFDAALVEMTENGYIFPGIQGCLRDCGGTDMDIMLARKILSQCGPEFESRLVSGSTDAEIRLQYELLDLCRKRIKHRLTELQEVTARLPYGLPLGQFQMTRKEFNAMITPMIRRTIQCCEQTIANAKKKPSDLALILLVGGSSNIPLVKEELQRSFACPVMLAKKPQLAVCQGAALSFDKGRENVTLPSLTPSGNDLWIDYNPSQGIF